MEVLIRGIPITHLGSLVTTERVDWLKSLAEEVRQILGTRRVFNISSAAVGGGVAEMMQVLLAYTRGVGIDARWLVIQGTPEFFTITKRVHNWIHGSSGDGGLLGESERTVYERILQDNAEALGQVIRTGDIVILHDPQTAGLLHRMRNLGAMVLWRCHIGTEDPNGEGQAGWEFLRTYLEEADAYILTRAQYAPQWMDINRTHIIRPSIDPFSAKNVDLSSTECQSLLCSADILSGQTGLPVPSFTKRDGSKGTITRKARVCRMGSAPSVYSPTVVQVSRWDRLKDMQGVMEGFATYGPVSQGVHLMLVGPSVEGVVDDPEGEMVLNECLQYWEGLPKAVRAQIHLVTLPVEDSDENAMMVNAIQRHATVVVQKSLAEGFGLTVTEAMWKGRPVVASEVGGIPSQIIDGEQGILLSNPRDLKQLGDALNRLIGDPALRQRLGDHARGRVIREYLADRHLEDYARLIRTVLAHPNLGQ
jgi:trehalose synthase